MERTIMPVKSASGTEEGALHAHVEYTYKKYNNFCLRLALLYYPLVFFTVCQTNRFTVGAVRYHLALDMLFQCFSKMTNSSSLHWLHIQLFI